jgi:hypothetical protein
MLRKAQHSSYTCCNTNQFRSERNISSHKWWHGNDIDQHVMWCVPPTSTLCACNARPPVIQSCVFGSMTYIQRTVFAISTWCWTGEGFQACQLLFQSRASEAERVDIRSLFRIHSNQNLHIKINYNLDLSPERLNLSTKVSRFNTKYNQLICSPRWKIYSISTWSPLENAIHLK